jgi:aspartate 1-decarboxylase
MPDNLVVSFPKLKWHLRSPSKAGNYENGARSASVKVKGRPRFRQISGALSITVPDDAVFIFSYVGYDENNIAAVKANLMFQRLKKAPGSR